MRLADRLERLPENRELVRSAHTTLTRDQATQGVDAVPSLQGARIALQVADISHALVALSALDGIADSILLLSPALDPDTALELVRNGACDAVLCDTPDQFADLPAAADLQGIAAQFDGPRAAPTETRWIMTTSGTTGTPKLVSHTLSSLTRSTRVDANRGAGQSWGMLYDYTRFAGLQVVLQSVLSGACLIAPDYAAPLEDKLDLFAANGCTHLSGTPTLWRKIVMTPGCNRLPLQQVTLGGEISDDRVLAAVAATYPDARVVHIFASTEAGVGFSVRDGKAGFPETYLTDPPAGVELRVTDDQLFIRNPRVAQAYLGTDTAFASVDGWVATGDLVSIRNGRVFFLGRGSGVINVGGDKVHPEKVETALLAHPLVSVARVYSKSNPITGALVAADIMLSDPETDPKTARQDILAHARNHLARFEVPAMLRIVDDMTLNSAGKLVRKG